MSTTATETHAQNGTNGTNGVHATNGHANGSSDINWNLETYHADLAKRLRVERSTKAFASGAYSLVSLPAGAVFAPMLGTTSDIKAYSSVQRGPDDHFELNSELVFCNHSCAPTLEFDAGRMEVRVARDRDLKAGDALTFWYPSTEWEMAQPFQCFCGAEKCKGWISGAKDMNEEVLQEYWLNDHIEKLLLEKKAKQNGAVNGNGVSNGVH